jgi:hypothetical protein
MLSSSEAKYVAMLEAIKEICCTFYLLRSILIEVKIPTVARCNNLDAIF